MNKSSLKNVSLLLALILVLISLPVGAVRAQESPTQKGSPSVKETSGQRRGRRARGGGAAATQKTPPVPKPTPTAPVAVAVVNKAEPEYLSGEANVTVNPKQPTVIKIGLAQNATSVIELPASDFIYYTHEGNPQLVAIFDSPTKDSDHFITLMPGTGFVAPPAGVKGPTATITLQMQSGLVITLIVVPVSDVMYNAHRCVINYNREEVVAARKAAGLAVNLDGKDRPPARPNATTTRVGRPAGDEGDSEREAGNNVRLVADVDSTKADGKKPKKGSKPADPTVSANKALVASVKSSNKLFTKWSASSHGMSVSLAPAVDLDERSRLVVVAVRNDTTDQLRLVPGNPDIFVQWFDEKSTPLNITEIKKLHVETTSVGGRIPAGQVVYYAIVYETPILGALQRVRVSVAQISASDQPVAADLTSEAR
jgi:hypothetical protein